MITLPELLRDKRYREFFSTVPRQGPIAQNWRVLVQRKADGAWAKKDFERYADAFRLIAKQLKEGKLHDGTIQSRGIAYGPPERIVRVTRRGQPVMVKTTAGKFIQKTAVVVWRPQLSADEEDHVWCTYCRRPTVFRWFATHRAIRNSPVAGCVDPTDRRCTICGGREEFIRGTLGSAARPKHNIVAPAGKRRRRS